MATIAEPVSLIVEVKVKLPPDHSPSSVWSRSTPITQIFASLSASKRLRASVNKIGRAHV